MDFDISITGGGFFTIRGNNDRAVFWMNEYVDGSDAGTAHSDDVRMVTDIAEEAMSDGMNVEINGKTYLGDGHAAA